MKYKSVMLAISVDEMEWLILKYIKKHDVKRKEATKLICMNGFQKEKVPKEVVPQ